MPSGEQPVESLGKIVMISWKKRGIVLCLILPLALVGCAEKQKEGEGELTPVPEENRLTLFTSHKPEVYQPILVEFENRTGIIVDVTAGGTTERMEEIENFAIGSVDVMFGGGEESYAAYADCFTPYETDSRENLDPKIFTEDAVWTPFSELPLVLIYNTRLVDEDDVVPDALDAVPGDVVLLPLPEEAEKAIRPVYDDRHHLALRDADVHIRLVAQAAAVANIDDLLAP